MGKEVNVLRVSMVCLVLVAVLLLLAVVALGVGSAGYSLQQIIQALFYDESGPVRVVVYNLRLPRLIMAVEVGACLAVAGNMTSIAKQVKHPVPLFSTDNNGFVIDLPAVDRAGAISVNGSLIFGVGTQTNNRFNAGTLLVPDAKGNFRTVIGARGWSASFIDTGSNGLYFDYDGSLAKCTGDASHFYCPANPLSLPASLTGLNAASLAATVLVDHATSMFAAPQKSVLPALAGPIGNANSFDWGLPFYYGRRVFMTIEGQTSAIGTGPVYAF